MNRLKHCATIVSDFSSSCHVEWHVPLTIEIGPTVSLAPRYWRLIGPENRDFIEVGLERDSGRLISVTVLLYSGALRREIAGFPRGLPKREAGVPAFELNLWPKPKHRNDVGADHIDCPGSPKIQLDTNGQLCVILFPDVITYEVVEQNRFHFGMNEAGELCSVLVTGIESSELATLEERFGWETSS